MKADETLDEKQMAVIEDMFACELDEQGILDKHKLSRREYIGWLGDENFRRELLHRMEIAMLLSEVFLAKYAVTAAVKLVQLTSCEKEETARKACLDIITLPYLAAQKTAPPAEEEPMKFSDETASRLLALLAEEKQV
jgi:hypothetical protein